MGYLYEACWYFVTIFILVRNIVGSVFGPVRFLLPVCRLGWFLSRKLRRNISWTDGRTEGRTDRWTEVKQYIPLPFGERGYTYEIKILENCNFQGIKCVGYCFIVIFSFCCWPLKYTAVNKIWNIEIKNLENCNTNYVYYWNEINKHMLHEPLNWDIVL
jgi:hypothetical protein